MYISHRSSVFVLVVVLISTASDIPYLPRSERLSGQHGGRGIQDLEVGGGFVLKKQAIRSSGSGGQDRVALVLCSRASCIRVVFGLFQDSTTVSILHIDVLKSGEASDTSLLPDLTALTADDHKNSIFSFIYKCSFLQLMSSLCLCFRGSS